MANYSKAFNFRGGFQVDTDVLLVRGQNVGIGSTVPQERLDVDGTIFTRGLRIEADEVRGDITTIDKANVGVLSVTEDLYVGVADTAQNQNFFPFIRPAVRITTGIITSADPAIGVVTYYGDGGSLLNLPTSQWLDVDPGIGFTSVYAQGNVGVGTTMPVHTFQVGGSPFPREFVGMNVGFQTGIGMEKGNIYASGIVSTRGEFSGIGSLITNIDARNLGLGTIPVERYGPLIVTDTVIASSFIGTATTAIGVRTDSFLDFDRGRANELEAVSRFISSEGKFQMGNVSYFDPVADAGDIDIVKTSQTTVYALSEDNSSRIFVGKERNSGTQRRFGGFRFGGDPQDPDSQENDLDIVNYDVGNINLYLHSGSGNIQSTIGEFRFIYGKTDRILTTINKNGRLRVNVNSNPNEASLDVVGFSTLRGDTYVGSDFYLAGDGKTQGDFEIGGRLILNDATLAGATFTQDVIVGQDPKLGVGDGVGLGTTGSVIASKSLIVWGVGAPAVEASSTGDISIIGSLAAQNSVISNIVDTNTIELDTAMVGPNNYALDANGMTVDDASVGSLRAVGGTISLRSPIEYYTLGITSTTITVDNINVADSISGNFDITANNITILQDVTVSSDIFTQNLFATGITSTSTLRGDNSSIGIADASSLNVTGEINTDTFIANGAIVNGDVDTDGLNTINASIGNVSNTTAFLSGIDVTGIIDSDTVNSTDGTFTSLNITDLNVNNVTSNPSFSGNVNVTGTLNVATVTATDLTATDATIQTASISTVDSDVTFTGNVGVAGTIIGGDLQTNGVTVNNVTTNTLGVNSITTNVDILGDITARQSIFATGQVGASTVTTSDLFATDAEISRINGDISFTANVTVPGNITATSIAGTSITAENLSAGQVTITNVTNNPTFDDGLTSSNTITTSDLIAAQGSITLATIQNLGVSSVTNQPTFTNGAVFEAFTNIATASVGFLTASTIQTQNLNVSTITTPNIGFSSMTGDNVTLNDTLSTFDLSSSGTANLNNLTISGAVNGTATFLDDIAADSASVDTITANTADIGTVNADNLEVANSVTSLPVDALSASSADVNNLVVQTGVATVLTVSDLVVTGTISGNYTQSVPPIYNNLTVTDLTSTNITVTGTATIDTLTATNISGSPSADSMTFSGSLNAASATITNLGATAGTIDNITSSGTASLTTLDVSGDVSMQGAVSITDLTIADLTATAADFTTATIDTVQGDVSFTGIGTGTSTLTVNGEVDAITLTGSTVRADTIEGTSPGAFYYPATGVRFHPGFTQGGNLYFRIEDGDGNFVGFASIEILNTPTDSF